MNCEKGKKTKIKKEGNWVRYQSYPALKRLECDKSKETRQPQNPIKQTSSWKAGKKRGALRSRGYLGKAE